MDDGLGGGFNPIATSLLAVTRTTVTSTSHNVKKGLSYRFRYKVKNVIGFSDYSDTVSLLAASVPDAPQPVTYFSSTATEITVKINASLEN